VSSCSFCHDGPVYNAGAWVAPAQPVYAACPRCGRKFEPPREDDELVVRWEAQP